MNLAKSSLITAMILLVVLVIGCTSKGEPTRISEGNKLYLDIHRDVHGVTPEKIAAAHQKDLAAQDKYGVTYLKYWYNQKDGTIFCLAEGPSEEAVRAVHRDAMGAEADQYIEVMEGH
jgi:uncharacterized protein YcfL